MYIFKPINCNYEINKQENIIATNQVDHKIILFRSYPTYLKSQQLKNRIYLVDTCKSYYSKNVQSYIKYSSNIYGFLINKFGKKVSFRELIENEEWVEA